MAHVAVDGTHLHVHGKGVSRFLESWLWTYAAMAPRDSRLTVLVRRAAPLPPLPRHPAITYQEVVVGRRVLWEQVGLLCALRRLAPDSVFAVADRMPVLWPKRRLPLVIYLFEIPDYRQRSNRTHAGVYQRFSDRITDVVFPRTLAHADRIVTSSWFTLRDVMTLYGIPREKLRVVYPAADPRFRPAVDDAPLVEVRKRFGVSGGYVLHFSSWNDTRDNTPVVLEAFARSLGDGDHGFDLVVGGVDRLPPAAERVVERHPLLRRRVRTVGFLTGDALVAVYQSADVYLDASLYEGFGFQVAEALACGTPVVCSQTTSLPEVAGDAALLVNPTDVASIAEALTRVLGDPALREDLRGRGFKQTTSFSWTSCVGGILDVLKAVGA